MPHLHGARWVVEKILNNAHFMKSLPLASSAAFAFSKLSQGSSSLLSSHGRLQMYVHSVLVHTNSGRPHVPTHNIHIPTYLNHGATLMANGAVV